MRKILSVITVLVFTQILNAQKVSVVSSDQNHLKINVRVSAADLIQDIKHEGVQYKLIKSANNHSLEIGKPDLPALGEWILIPNDGQFEIVVEKGEP